MCLCSTYGLAWAWYVNGRDQDISLLRPRLDQWYFSSEIKFSFSFHFILSSEFLFYLVLVILISDSYSFYVVLSVLFLVFVFSFLHLVQFLFSTTNEFCCHMANLVCILHSTENDCEKTAVLLVTLNASFPFSTQQCNVSSWGKITCTQHAIIQFDSSSHLQRFRHLAAPATAQHPTQRKYLWSGCRYHMLCKWRQYWQRCRSLCSQNTSAEVDSVKCWNLC